MNAHHIYTELENNLPKSSAADRQIWTRQILEEEIDLIMLFPLIFGTPQIATRFLWLLSEIGSSAPKYLKQYLPYLFTILPQLSHLKSEGTFANYWLLCGIPNENEAEVITLLFDWINSPNTNVTTKSRSIKVIEVLPVSYTHLTLPTTPYV